MRAHFLADNPVSATQLVGATPPKEARPVSLAVRDYLVQRLRAEGPNYAVACAVSGGADSLALAVAVADVAVRMNLPATAFVVDHQMRKDSAEESAAVQHILIEIGFTDARVLRGSELSLGGEAMGNLETRARQLRHRLLEEAACRWGDALDQVDLLFAHTMEDQAETVLLRLGRGASPSSLAAMAPILDVEGSRSPRLSRGRPLLSVRRNDTERFCASLGLHPLEDPTNRADGPWRTKQGFPLPRAAVRENVLPALRTALGQDPVPALARVAELLREEQAVWQVDAERLLAQAVSKDSDPENRRVKLDVSVLQGSPTAVKAVALACNQVGIHGYSAKHLRALVNLIDQAVNARGEPREAILPGGARGYREGQFLVIEGEVKTMGSQSV